MNGASRYRAVALDIDGTIVQGGETYAVDHELAALLRELTDDGVHLALATGRMYPGARLGTCIRGSSIHTYTSGCPS